MNCLQIAASLIIALGVVKSLDAQEEGAILYTVGTSVASEGGEPWGYVLWQSTADDLLLQGDFAIYSKAGGIPSLSPYGRRSVITVQTDPTILSGIIERARQVGEDVAALEERIDNLFDAVLPGPNLSLAMKLSAVIQGSMADPSLQDNLILLSRLHPAVSMAIGQAYAGPIDGLGMTTFEVRKYDRAADEDLGVVGRVVVEAGAPVLLPAPGRPVDVTIPDPRGHLGVRLRWGTPAELRRLSLLQYGFNLYRISKETAETANLDATPPSNEALDKLLASGEAIQVNRLPVLGERDLDDVQAQNRSFEPGLFFTADENNRFHPDAQPFKNGDQFYYFVAARDVLGRIGLVSPGSLVTICDRMPPPTPLGVEVRNDYSFINGVGEQRLEVVWRQNADDHENSPTTSYYVYRWSSLEEMHKNAGDPFANLISAPIPHQPGVTTQRFIDNNAGAPVMPEDAGKTFWYTVRAEDDGACGTGLPNAIEGNLSGNSAPAFGVLRLREGPATPGGELIITCAVPEIFNKRQFAVGRQGFDPDFIHFTIAAQRYSPGIDWAEFYLKSSIPRLPDELLGRVYFGRGVPIVAVQYGLSPALKQAELILLTRVGTRSGEVTGFEEFTAAIPPEGSARIVIFDARVNYQRVKIGEDCNRHFSRIPGMEEADIQPVEGTVLLTPRTREWKVYRRIDDGPLVLIAQGEADFNEVPEVEWRDDAMPGVAQARVCYYAQVFDEHGNPSALERLDCTEIEHSDLPMPMLARPKVIPGGSPDARRARLEWFCSPHGVERFEVWIAPRPDRIPDRISEGLSPNLAGPGVVVYGAGEHEDRYRVYQTPRIGSGFGDGGAGFSVEVDVEEGKTYLIKVRAVGPGGYDRRIASEDSNFRTFTWRAEPVIAAPEVPWPARELPAQANGFIPQLEAVILPAPHGSGGAIRIGEFSLSDELGRTQGATAPFLIPPDRPPEAHLYRSLERADAFDSETALIAFPFVLYRYQVPSEMMPAVSGGIVQVSPLMKEIAYESGYEVVGKDKETTLRYNRIHDPFVTVVSLEQPNLQGNTHEIYVLDTQPMLLYGKYRYLLVRFGEDGEIDRIVQTNTINFGG